MRALGFTTANGSSVSTINNLKQYGLLSKDKDGYSIGEYGRMIVEARSPADRDAALLLAAWAPPVFADMRSEYGVSAHTDAGVREYLRRRGFLPPAIERLLEAYRQTFSVAERLSRTGSQSEAQIGRDEGAGGGEGAPAAAGSSPTQDPARPPLFSYRTESGAVSIVVQGSLSDQVIVGIVSVWLEAKKSEIENSRKS